MGERNGDDLRVPARIILAHEEPFALGVLKVEPATRQVAAGARSETLEPRVMQVLVALARAEGAIVTRDGLIDACWEGRIVGDDAINRVLSRIRQVAADIGGGSFAIETITKVGYRLRANAAPEPAPQSAARSVCVLPFVNMSGDTEQEYFSDGISEDITTDLSKVSALAVTARNTAFQFKGQAADMRDIAHKLGVSHLLEGSVRKAGNTVRISAQLIDGATGDHVWAERYDRDLTDIFAIQDEISEAVVDALKLKLLPEERDAIEHRGTDSVEAYELYLMGRRCWITGDFGDQRREETVIRLCRRATEIDPDYARAWALMALAQANLVYAYTGKEDSPDGTEAARRALALDASIAEAHLPLAWHFAVRGCFEEANAETAEAVRLNPHSWEVNKETARIYWRQRRVEEAARYLEAGLQIEKNDLHGHGMLGACYANLERSEDFAACAKKVLPLAEDVLSRDPHNGSALAWAAMATSALGDFEAARKWRQRALLFDPDNFYMRFNLAWPLLLIERDEEGARALLEEALANGGPNLVSLINSSAPVDPLRSDPEFVARLDAALKRVGLTQ